MIKRTLSTLTIVLAASLASAPTVAAADSLTGKTAFGFQGVILGNYLNGVSARQWTNGKFGWEGNLLYGNLKASAGSMDITGDITALEAKGMYSLVEKTNSKMYVGAKLAYGHYKLEYDGYSLINGNLWQPGVLAGAEWCIPQLPEVGFNFEVGYNFAKTKPTIGGSDVDLKLHGTNVTFGVHYYF